MTSKGPVPSPENGWYEEIAEIERRRALALKLGGETRIARQHAAGKLTVRERIDGFLDPESFFEIGRLAGTAAYDRSGRLLDFQPAGFVMGLGKVDGRLVCLGGEDFTVSGGAYVGPKSAAGFLFPFAKEYRIPLVQFTDGVGASPRAFDDSGLGGGEQMYLPEGNLWAATVELLGIVPVATAVLGPSAGGVAAQALLCHFSVMTKGSGSIFAAGPPVVKRAIGEELTKEELGGTSVHVRQSGVIDNEAEDEQDAFRQIRTFLSYMPSNVWELPPYMEPKDSPNRREERLATIVPKDRQRAYDMRELIRLVVDDREFFEIREYYGPSLITALARMNGYVVGIVANNPLILAGALTAAAAEKQTHFVEMCNAFNIPLLLLVDVPGFMIGSQAEASGTLRAGMRGVVASTMVSVPHVAIQIRKSYGMGGDVPSSVGGPLATKLRFGWPSGEWGSLPIEGGVAAAYRREISSAPDPDAKRREIEARLLTNRGTPFHTAENFGVMDLIDPRETRPVICQFIEAAQPALRLKVGFKGPVRP